jgi:hypothetical protein
VYTHLAVPTDASAMRAAACQPTAAGLFYDQLPAAPVLASLQTPLAQAQRGILEVCPGLAVPGAVSALAFPAETAFPVGTRTWQVSLACPRDCLYLVTLERAGGGVPMLARRGALRGGVAPTTVTLPALPVPAGTYRLTVRAVPQVNPGTIFLEQSADLTVG